MTTVARFATWGHSLALRIPSSVAREMHVSAGSAAKLSVENSRLVIAPVEEVPVYRLSDLVAGITDENRYGEIGTGAAQGNEFG